MHIRGYGLIPGILAGLLTGALVGAINGFLVTKIGIPSFLVTLGWISPAGTRSESADYYPRDDHHPGGCSGTTGLSL
jgi:hypothetical protein